MTMPNLKVLLSLGVLVALLGACDKSSVDSRPEASSDVGSSRHASGFVMWNSPQPVATLAFQGDKDQPLRLEDFRGKVVVLNVWATWCVPCREEMPTLDNLQAKLGGPNLEVLALSIDQAGPKVVREFFRDIGIKHLRLYIDPSGQALNTLDILGIPTTLLLDRRGREMGRLVGIAKWDSAAMLQFLESIIEQTKGDSP